MDDTVRASIMSIYPGIDLSAAPRHAQCAARISNYTISRSVQYVPRAECAAAGYTLIRGWGFARHLRTNVDEEAGVWRADAIYTISPALPRGLRTIDAEVVALACAEKGIPTV